ncbi:hypothetical protein ACTPD5_22425 [Clostridioides difficile]
MELAKLVAKDGEGCTKLIECYINGALSEEHAVKLAIIYRFNYCQRL